MAEITHVFPATPNIDSAEAPRCQAEARIRAIDGTANDTFQHMAQSRGTSDYPNGYVYNHWYNHR